MVLRRWIPLPFFQFQPSEFGMVLLILALSAFAVERSRRMSEHRTTARILLLALIPAMIVMGQSDLGRIDLRADRRSPCCSSSAPAGSTSPALAALFVVAIAIVLTVAPTLGVNVLKNYQKQRLTTFINPPRTCSPNDANCYQLDQGLIALGSGQKTGRGCRQGHPGDGQLHPRGRHDFIFASSVRCTASPGQRSCSRCTRC